VGNHEYNEISKVAQPSFDSFSATNGFLPPAAPNTPDNPGLRPGKGYYSYDLGSWHVVVLNSNCDKVVGRCGAGPPQEQWLSKTSAYRFRAQKTARK
jgi:hypothetical protein